MKKTILAIGVIRRDDTVLLRKKPNGSAPYKESWYLFGGELESENQNPEKVLKETLKKQAGVDIKFINTIGQDAEIKPDHDGHITSYIYLDCLCEYVSGELIMSEGIEKLEWVPISKLNNYDLVPPTRKLFIKLGYLSA